MSARIAVVLLLSTLLAPAVAGAAAGDRDPTFNGGEPYRLGLQAAGTTSDQTVFDDVLVDGLGRTVLGGRYTKPEKGFGLIARLRGDGTADPAFSDDGRILPRYDGGFSRTVGAGIFTDPNGRLGGGFAVGDAGTFATARYTDSGTEDAEYATDGVAQLSATVSGDTSTPELRRTFGGSDGSTTFIGSAGVSAAYDSARVIRLDLDGTPVPGFGTAGRATVALPPCPGSACTGRDRVSDGLVYPDGRVLLVGTATDAANHPAWMVMRLTAAGAVDTTFGGGDGSVIIQAGSGGDLISRGTDVALAPDNRIYVTGEASAGSAQQRMAVARLTTGGDFDQSFGVRAVSFKDIEPTHETLASYLNSTAVGVQPDGKVILAGSRYAGDTTPQDLVVVRFTTAGVLDTTFGGGDGAIVDRMGTFVRALVARARDLTVTANRVTVVGTVPLSDDGSFGAQAFAVRYVTREPSDVKPPENQQAPGLTGTPKPASVLTCVAGTWSNNPTVTVAWDRAPRATTSPTDPAWQPIAGSTARTYTVQTADLGSRVRCREIATNVDGSATAPSPSKRVEAGVPALLRAPTLSGTPVVGQVLTCDVGEWSNGPDLTVRWLRGSETIGPTTRTYTLVEADRRSQIGCEVSAANDIGPAASAAKSSTVLAVGAPPTSTRRPIAGLGVTGPKPTDAVITCEPGQWDEDYGVYDFRWQREGAEIAGQTGRAYTVTVDDLGRNITCQSFSTNPAGRSTPATSNPVLVPLPATTTTGPPGRVFQAGGFNALDPTNMLAVPGDYLAVIGELSLARMRSDLQNWRVNYCKSTYRDTPRANFDKALERAGRGRQIYYDGACGVINFYPEDQIRVTLEGVYWHGGACAVPGDASTSGPKCPQLMQIVYPIDPARTSSFSMDEQARLAATQPTRTLWDFDADGRVDASCDADAPILRSLYSRGVYHARAVVLNRTSGQTGNYAVIDHELVAHPRDPGQRGELRDAQPFACRTSIDPPPEPQRPCTSEATVGRVHVEGNLCPISMRQIPPGELDNLPGEIQDVLEKQALAGPLRRRATIRAVGGLGAAPGQLAYDATANISALATLADTREATVPKAWADKLRGEDHYDAAAAQFAMDQIYIARGTAKVNGVDVDPRNGSSLVMVPSDAGAAVDTVKKMTLSAKDAATTLGGVPIGDPGKLTADLADRLDVTPPTLREVNLDRLADDLKSKLNLGPFKLAGDTKLRLADDGSAFLDAHAELPGLLGGPGSSPIRTDITVHADQSGKIKLEGIHLQVPKAYLAAVKIKDLQLDYDGAGLSVKGQLLFPPVDAGIAINRFRLDDKGKFKELDVDYLAGAGQGIPVGPGIFMTKLGGGFSLDPDEIRGRATFGVGPSTGGGCPTAGIEAGFVVHFAPAPFYVEATGDVVILCVPILETRFYADSTGLVDLTANLHFDAGPVYFGAKLHGALKLPRWQLDLHGEGGIRHLITAEIKALIGNLGVAGCGTVKLLFVPLSAGAGVRFSNGRPPLSFSELANNIRIFTGCDLSSWSPFGRDVRSAATGGGRTFELPDGDIVALEVIGSGGAPRVRLTAPDGRVLDASAFTEDLTHGDGIDGLLDPAHDRTVLFVKGQEGEWSLEPAEGSPAIVDLRHASVLPKPKVTAMVGGAGAARRLRYDVARVPGQEVRFVEHSRLGQRVITTVKGGGRGTKAFLTSEGQGTARTVVAEVVQDGMPRDNLTVARFRAPSPSPTRPRRVRIRRSGRITWRKSAYAARYEVVVTTASGNRVLLDAKRASVRRKRAVRASVVAISPAGHRSRPGTGRLVTKRGRPSKKVRS